MSNYEFNFSSVSPVDQQDITELERRISDFQRGKEDTERFRLYRLTRGVYGQRQEGVQMFRLKLPYGRVNAEQLVRIADVSDRYATGNLHITTRQNVQLHYVKLANSPKVWTELAQLNLTAREACGNTVRNFTASPTAGIDPQEPFDVSPYAEAAFQYFLRNPICQEMGRKIKIAFSSSEADSAFTYFHDYGFIPKIQIVDGVEQRGFKVLVGGGLGAQAITGLLAYEFLPEDQIIPFMEAGIRIFDRFGEREKRMKARMKFLIQKLGFEAWMELVKQEWKALKNKVVEIDRSLVPEVAPLGQGIVPALVKPVDEHWYQEWLRTNTFEQKQKGFFGVYVRIVLGDLPSDKARALAAVIKDYAADDIRFTINQGLLLKFVRPEALPVWFNALHALGLALPGADSTADITACPGTDTCALGVTNSTGLSRILEELIREEYPDLIDEKFFKIKISGCMNACGQHMAANLGFHGSSFKHGDLVIPAMQVVLGGGVAPDGRGFIADKIVKVPTKRIPDVVRAVIDDFNQNGQEGEYYNDYFLRQGEKYFYALLKPLADLKTLTQEEYFDWGQDRLYKQEIGVGECAGVMLDMVGVILQDAFDKIKSSRESLGKGQWADAIYSSYAAFVVAAKGMLLSKDVKCNTQKGVIDDFQTHYVAQGDFTEMGDFTELVLQINQYEPEENFAMDYADQAERFVRSVVALRESQLEESNGIDKKVVGDYYRA